MGRYIFVIIPQLSKNVWRKQSKSCFFAFTIIHPDLHPVAIYILGLEHPHFIDAQTSRISGNENRFMLYVFNMAQ